MSYYDALKTQWLTLPQNNTIQQNLALLNETTVAGPSQDVSIGAVVGYLALQGKLASLKVFVAAPPDGASAQAIVAANELLTLVTTPQINRFQMSDPMIYGAVNGFLDALVTASLITQGNEDALLAMAATTETWWKANGYTSPFNEHDLIAAGIYAEADAIADGILGVA